MARTDRRTKREPKERPLPLYVREPDPVIDEITAARLVRDFPLEEYPGAARADLVVTDEGRVLVKGDPDDLVIIGEPLTPPTQPRLRLVTD